VLPRGHLVESWREAVCDAFAHTLGEVEAGRVPVLETVAGDFGLPPGSVCQPFVRWSADIYAQWLAAAVADLRSRVGQGQRLVLVCGCAPKRCHAEALAACVGGWG